MLAHFVRDGQLRITPGDEIDDALVVAGNKAEPSDESEKEGQ